MNDTKGKLIYQKTSQYITNLSRHRDLKLKIFLIILISLFFNLKSVDVALAGPASSNFQLEEYGFGAGGVASSSSENFLFSGAAGEVETASLSSANYLALPGLTYTLQPNIPAPTFTNPSNYYNKLLLKVNNAGYPSDTLFAIQISTDPNFLNSVNYVLADDTLGLSPVFQTYTAWGGASGFNIIGLTTGTTYYARVAAKRGVYQQGPWGAVASAATVNATFTFNIQTSNQASPPFSVGVGIVNAGQVTTSWQSVTATISTNANTGGIIYLNDVNSGLKSTEAGNYTISSATVDLTGASEGYGVQGQSVTQTSGGPMELISPYNGSSNNIGGLDTIKRVFADSTASPVTNGQTTFQVKAKASTSTPAATDYADTITVIGTGSF